MTVPPSLSTLVATTRAETSRLLDQARAGSAEQFAQAAGRTASWLDEAGHSLGQVTDAAAGTLAGLTYHAAGRAGRGAERACDRLARMMGQWSQAMGDRVVHLAEEFSPARGTRD